MTEYLSRDKTTVGLYHASKLLHLQRSYREEVLFKGKLRNGASLGKCITLHIQR